MPLKSKLDDYIKQAFNRASNGLGLKHRFTLTADELKRLQGKQRLTKVAIEDCLEFFRHNNVTITFNPQSNSFALILDIETCSYDLEQASHVKEVMQRHAEHTFKQNFLRRPELPPRTNRQC